MAPSSGHGGAASGPLAGLGVTAGPRGVEGGDRPGAAPARPGLPVDGGPLRCREPATATVQIDDAAVRVTRWDFNPGAETGWHRHGFVYVVVPVTDGTVLLEMSDGGTAIAELKAGASYSRFAGVEHNVVNAGTTPLAFVEVEIKGLPG